MAKKLLNYLKPSCHMMESCARGSELKAPEDVCEDLRKEIHASAKRIDKDPKKIAHLLKEENDKFEEWMETCGLTEDEQEIIQESRVNIKDKLHLSLNDYICELEDKELLRTLFPNQLVTSGFDKDLDGDEPNSRAIVWGPPGSGKTFAFACILGEVARILEGHNGVESYAPVVALETKASRCKFCPTFSSIDFIPLTHI